MLGLKRNKGWSGFIFGKHPSFKDFLRLGQETPLTTGLARWVEGGYRHLSRKDLKGASVSWRFWCRGGKDLLLCGLLKDSADALGRPFPLLLILSWKLTGWEKSWEKLVSVLEETWRELERLAARPWASPFEFETGLDRLPEPRTILENGQTEGKTAPFFRVRNGCFWSPLGEEVSSTALILRLKRQFQAPPLALFMGGAIGATAQIVVFTSPLRREDFSFLWQKESRHEFYGTGTKTHF